MAGTFFGIEIARRALGAQQRALDVAGHNIANANTKGYSRQVAHLVSTTAYPPARLGIHRPEVAGQLGTGVTVASISRMHDAFIQNQIDGETTVAGQWEMRQDALTQIEQAFLEPSDAGVRSSLDKFWNALQELGGSSESAGVRAAVTQHALELAGAIRGTAARLDPLAKNIDQTIRERVLRINAIAGEIAGLNREIAAVVAAGQTPNDFLDRRDQLINELSKITDVAVIDRAQGQVAVSAGGILLVEGEYTRTIEAVSDPATNGFVRLQWEGLGAPVAIGSGELAGLFEARDQIIPEYAQKLDELAFTLITEINNVHQNGYTLGAPPPPAGPDGGLFFTGTDASTIDVHPAIQADPNKIAASANGESGNGDIALQMAAVKSKKVMVNGTVSPSDFWAATVAALGVQAQEADGIVEQQKLLLEHLSALRESVAGVSLDEEMIGLVQYQHAYGAAARVMTTMDEALDVLINRMGIVGR